MTTFRLALLPVCLAGSLTVACAQDATAIRRDTKTSAGAPLPPAEDFQPRPHGAEVTATGLKPEVLARIDIELQRHVAARNIAGLVALIHHHGHRGYCEAFGLQDIEAGIPMAKDSIFRLMSMTKPLIAVTALVLHDEGKFGLDDPISKHLPEWAQPKVLENGQPVPARRPITPRMLMSHSSGLYYGKLEGATGGGVAAMAYQAGRAGGATLKDFSEAAAKEPLKFQPGAGYHYGISIDILGRYLEAVTGKPLDEVMREKLTGPLQMVDTDFWVPPDKLGRLCQIYRQPSPGVLEPGRQAADPKVKPTLFMGGHGMLSTIGDYERFCRMILNRGELDGVRVLKPETADLIFDNHVPAPGQRYGLGGVVDGRGSYGWGGADGTQFWIDRTNQLLAIFMTQTDWYKAPTYQAFRALVFEAAGVAGGGGGKAAEGELDPAAGAFQQRDQNGDGKLDRDELPAALFNRLDANRDGFVTEDEFKALWQAGQRQGSAPKPPEPAKAAAGEMLRNAAAATPLARLGCTRDYFPGTTDPDGQYLGGTEAMWLAGFRGKLYAAIGYGQDQPGDDPRPGAQILRKDAPDAPWRVDHAFGPGFLRVEALTNVRFRTDDTGKKLAQPADMLLASPSDTRRGDHEVAVWTLRRPEAGWECSRIGEGYLGARTIGSHVDQVTGAHLVFAGLNRGPIHAGAYDPGAPGGIRWREQPERTVTTQYRSDGKVYDFSRVLCFAECNGDLYMASRITLDADNRPVDGGLYRRADGPRPEWKLVSRWSVDPEVLQSRYLRGLTAVPDPKGGRHEVLIANFEYPGTIVRFDPTKPDPRGLIAPELEIDLKDYFNTAWVTPGAQRRGAIAAYNRFLPATDAASGETVWLCGAWVERPGAASPPENGSVYLIRHRDGRYEWGYIYDPSRPVPAGVRLTGCRDIEPAPFAGEAGRVFYFCGYDGGAGPSHNTAWIYRGELAP